MSKQIIFYKIVCTTMIAIECWSCLPNEQSVVYFRMTKLMKAGERKYVDLVVSFAGPDDDEMGPPIRYFFNLWTLSYCQWRIPYTIFSLFNTPLKHLLFYQITFMPSLDSQMFATKLIVLCTKRWYHCQSYVMICLLWP